MIKKICLIGFAAAAISFAQEETGTYIRNICDTLPASATPKVELRLAYVDDTQWFGSKDLSKKDSSFVKRYQDYESVKPFRNKVSLSLPVSITAECAETQFNLYKYAEWDQTKTTWTLNAQNDDYATQIMDINLVQFPGYDASNAYNILAMRKGSLPEDGAYKSGELLVSKTFEFQFDWWLTIAAYKTESTRTNDQGGTDKITSWQIQYANTMDSLSSVTTAVKNLKVPDSVSKVQYQQFHVVLTDPNKKTATSSSSVASSSSETASSSSVASSSSEVSSSSVASSSSKEKSSSSEASSSSVEESSSSQGTTSIARLESSPRAFGNVREVRRLDGSVVKSSETLVPGVYYVKGMDGRWKKQVELP